MQWSGASVIFGITLVVSLLGLFAAPKIIEHSLLRPYWLTRNREYERLITSGFVHADLGHLIFNMITFYFFAFPLERRIGTMNFVSLYFIGMVLSEVGTVIKHRNNPEYASLGASGAILAVLFASIVYFPDRPVSFRAVCRCRSPRHCSRSAISPTATGARGRRRIASTTMRISVARLPVWLSSPLQILRRTASLW